MNSVENNIGSKDDRSQARPKREALRTAVRRGSNTAAAASQPRNESDRRRRILRVDVVANLLNILRRRRSEHDIHDIQLLAVFRVEAIKH